MVGRPSKRKALLWAGLGPTLVDSRILCRMRAVHGTYAANTIKYRSAGRLPAGSQGSVEFLFGLAASYTLSRFAGLPLKGKQVVTYLTFIFICYRQHFGESAACVGFSPFGAYGTTFPPQKRWDTPRAMLRVTYENTASRSFVLPPLAGEVPQSGQGGMLFPRPKGGCMVFSFPTGEARL